MMLTKDDIRGLCAMIPTPCPEGAEGWDNPNSVDLEETARMVEIMVQDGMGSFAACGTTGECAGLLWEEKVAFIDTVVQTNRGRVPLFAGATGLGTKETIRQMRALGDLGAPGVFVGLPLWQTPTIENSVQYYGDLGEAVPDTAIMIYANPNFFKSVFPIPFWEGIGQTGRTVVITKLAGGMRGGDAMPGYMKAAPQVNFMPGQAGPVAAYKAIGHALTTFWSSSGANMGPEPLLALWEAIQREDEKRVEEVTADLSSLPPARPEGKSDEFPLYNAQINKVVMNAAGYIHPGPTRAPYDKLPQDWLQVGIAHGKGWAEMRKKYIKASV